MKTDRVLGHRVRYNLRDEVGRMPSRKLKNTLHQILGISRRNIWLLLGLSAGLLWVLFLTFSNTLFSKSQDVLLSIRFDLAASAVFMLGMGLVYRLHRLPTMRRQPLLIFGSAFLAMTATYILIQPYYSLTNILSYLSGTVLGFGIILFSILFIRFFYSFELRESIVLLVVSFELSVLIFISSLYIFSSNYISYFVLILPAVSSIFIYIYYKMNSNRLSRIEHSNEYKFIKYKSRILLSLILSSSFLFFYMLNMYPKSTRYANIFYKAYLGTIGQSTILLLIFSSVLLIFILLFLIYRNLSTQILALFVTAIFAAIYLAIPSMKNSAFAFIMITPCAGCFLALSLFLYFKNTSLSQDAKSFPRNYYLGISIASLGALLATGFAAVFLGPLSDFDFGQDYMFIAIAAVLLIAIVVLAVMLRDDFLRMLIPNYLFRESLDTSSLENRCRVISKTCNFTARETEILVLLSEGRNAPYIESHLGVSRATVKSHISHIYQKVGVHSHQELLDLLRKTSDEDVAAHVKVPGASHA